MDKCLTSLERDFAAIRAGRANPAVLDKVMVDYYGVPTPINQMAAVSVPEARLLVVQPWDASTLKEIEKLLTQQTSVSIRKMTVRLSDFHSLSLQRNTERIFKRIFLKEARKLKWLSVMFAVMQWMI